MGAIKAWILQYALVLLGGVAVLGLTAAGVQTLRLAWLEAEVADDLAAATQKAREREHEWGLLFRENEDAKQTALRSVTAERDAALLGLRNRPQRMPEAARAACQGSTGRELSERDAAAFVGLAARADGLRAELAACYGREDALSR